MKGTLGCGCLYSEQSGFCPVEVAVSVLGGTWKLTLIKHLQNRPHRFNELGRQVPLANTKTLTRQLRELEEDGIVLRTVYAEVPPKVEYSLTPLGERLEDIVTAMEHWGAEFSREMRLDAESVTDLEERSSPSIGP
ncbi:winged helix-turn-helix transcriptional regulator [Gordonia polyisoprenivorans]|uniref:winged helix-turn-helix transcriptional regulator n=1 Tax=Gordonia polyisoprenivorans TaxID=84595 RepID=UPI0023E394AB|nr:helix-turn-helix domain-containing protein [Gordonia polyisoprenivorans]